ncbi:MAG TPA: DUF4185 domain-containing protein [Rudaea sp.]|jgi:hypothetical protein|uniref:DUF4185 domain-containing protein n=1 Tax=Rudaea sp. TaxID=2136325 RepID=UPI002F93DCBF
MLLISWCANALSAEDPPSSPKDSVPIVDVQLGKPIYLGAGGDSWDPTWAQDDNLYAAVNDGAGFGTVKENIGFNKIVGDNPLRLTGQTQDSMSEYGVMNAPIATEGRNWKSGGSISIDGVLYMSIGMDRYVDATYAGRQTRINSSIVKSSDHGLTWSRAIAENLNKPMFPGMRFATPFFIHYGKEYEAATVDNADRYVYATANNGFWDNGDNYILGRVLRSKINALNAADWTFYKGGDGLLDASWSDDVDKAVFIIDAPRQCGEGGVTYLPGLKRYVMAAWYYPVGNGHAGEIQSTEFAFYESPTPWGPWNKIKSIPIKPQGWYIPRVLSKFQTRSGKDLQAYIAVAGDWRNPKYYRYTMVPVKFVTASAKPVVNARPSAD